MQDTCEIDRSLIGSSTEPFPVDVEKGAIRRFAEAIGERSPIYFDAGFARSLGYGGIVAPPTFPVSFRPPAKPKWLEGLDEGRFLAGEQGFEYARPLTAGESLSCELRLSDVQEKKSSMGRMDLIVQDLMVKTLSGDLVCINRRIVIYRGKTLEVSA